MHTLQIKTLEQLVIDTLRFPNPVNYKAHAAFSYMLQHFMDEEYLYGVEHCRIITVIYIDNFYRYKEVKALSDELHIDTKTLLFYRKSYLKIFAKFYLSLTVPIEDEFLLLYKALKNVSGNLKK